MLIESGESDRRKPLIVTDACRTTTTQFILDMENTGWTIIDQLAMFDNTIPFIGDNYLMYEIEVEHFIHGKENYRVNCFGGVNKI